MYKLSERSKNKLKQVHPKLVKVVSRAIELSTVDFSVLEGVRSISKQKALVRAGASQTLKSNHLIQSDGYGHAVDLIPYPLSWDLEKFYPIAEAMKKAAIELNVNIRWGGCWSVLNTSNKPTKEMVEEYSKRKRLAKQKAFIDAPHFELI